MATLLVLAPVEQLTSVVGPEAALAATPAGVVLAVLGFLGDKLARQRSSPLLGIAIGLGVLQIVVAFLLGAAILWLLHETSGLLFQ